KQAKLLIDGLQEGLRGRNTVELPPTLLKALEPFGDELGEAPLTLALRQGEGKALAESLEIIADDQADIGLRLSYIQVMGEINEPSSVPVLLQVVENGQSSAALRQTALHA